MSNPTIYNTPVRPHKIAEAASDRLRNSPYRALRGISCECDQGVLLLRGHLPSFYYKQLAQETVARVKGVSQVVNEIKVGSATPRTAREGAPG